MAAIVGLPRVSLLIVTSCALSGLQLVDLCVFFGGSLQHFARDLGLGELDCTPLVLLGKFKSFMQLLFEVAVPNLLQDVCIARFVNLECFVAVWADDFVHIFRFRSVVAWEYKPIRRAA